MYVVIIGTRPEAIKLAPVINKLRDRNHVVKIILTGQHESVNDILISFKINEKSTYGIPSVGGDLNNKIGYTISRLSSLLKNCHTVIVQGDTYSALVGALAASNLGLKVAHVEAGLRTYNKFSPFPEENYRRMISAVADYHFAATADAAKNLKKEGYTNVFTTGNTVIDALSLVDSGSSSFKAFERKTLLLTLHRREKWGEPMKKLLDCIGKISEEQDVDILFPIHPNPAFKSLIVDLHPNIKVVEALGYSDFVAAMKACYFILTDSGGIQEEAPSLNKPVIVLRDTTERPEGLNRNAVLATTPEALRYYVKMFMENEDIYEQYATAPNPYGDGKASVRIVNQLETLRLRTKGTNRN